MLSKIFGFLNKLRPYVSLVFMIAYGLMIVFCLVGIALGKGYLPVVGMVLTCLTWAASRIMLEALHAFNVLRVVLRHEGDASADDDRDT